ncbi:MAG: hypothetical protein JXA60_10745 [Candidatus Coatesbacteria bacterium]|nr:hypothetical protein [Candidatus Coatesbacteria bacterium]
MEFNKDNYKRIVSHNDLDGVISSSLLSSITGIKQFLFTGPTNIINKKHVLLETDIICDLPYSTCCGAWFDHHTGNLEDLNYRKIDITSIPGSFSEQDSCARVIYNYFKDKISFSDILKSYIDIADEVDSFKYDSPLEWLAEKPSRILDFAIKDKCDDLNKKIVFLNRLTNLIKELTPQKLCEMKEIKSKDSSYRAFIKHNLEMIKPIIYFLKEDVNNEIVIIDQTRLRFQNAILRPLAFIHYPRSLAVLVISNKFQNKSKKADLLLSFSLGFGVKDDKIDLGEIFRTLNIGDGHKGAASASFVIYDKKDAMKMKESILREIFILWQKQRVI